MLFYYAKLLISGLILQHIYVILNTDQEVIFMIQPQNITQYFIDNFIKHGDIAVDATAGNGNDTVKLCSAVGKTGHVYAFDIQKCAIENTEKKLAKSDFENATLVHDSHSRMDEYVRKKIKAVIFNLGYLPGGDHSLCTLPETTIEAVEKSLSLLCDDGFVAITVYYGKNSGTKEKDAVMDYFKNLDYKKYTVTVHDFYNRPNNPPLTVIITKNT